MKKGSFINKFKPESMSALNYLIYKLSENYDVRIVISSTWRHNLPFAIKTLKENGLMYDKVIESTPISDPAKRGEQILEFLQDKQNYKMVIIDDEMFDFKKHFNMNNIIKTEMFHSALSLKDVRNFLNRENEITKQFIA